MELKRRVNLCNSHEVYMLVIARKLRETGPLPAPQQSDYAQDQWLHGAAAAPGAPARAAGARKALVARLATLGLIDALRAGRSRLRVWRDSGLSLPATDYQRVDVRSLLATPSPR
jgi:hypothetical protein